MAVIQQLKKNNSTVKVYPKTVVKAVYDEDGRTLDEYLVSDVVALTLEASGWDSTTKIYTVSDPRISTSSIQDFNPAVGITNTQLEALQKANIQDGGQDAGHAYLKAYGELPAIDIPVTVMFNRGAKAGEVNMNYTISTIEVPSSGWSSTTTTVDGSAYYTQTIKVESVEIVHPNVSLGASGTLPTTAEKTAYGCLDYVTVDILDNTITFYAIVKPSSNFVVIVEGIKAAI